MRMLCLLMLMGLFILPICFAEGRGSKTDAENLVKKSINYLQKNGREKSFKAFTAPSTEFIDRDIYVVAYDRKGNCYAHGQTEKMVGKNFISIVDVSGKEYMKERVKLSGEKNEFWHSYKFTDPLTKQVLNKDTFCTNYQELIICAGVYHEN
ncbi:cache domain-containing protein [Iodobacter sp. CM08]|uniref:cache domain-containing protein n=1 Tax=Iodobacter sp. CM08 TaxID=3085902 RepID=UPI0029813161|nr:cache domain-containing protein [Iodobacter sp. CM08]MDW5417551.1 cache domain-containing protein [Iodobacter sp. CM08]